MRTLVDIEDGQIRDLDELARRAKLSRAALIRQAIAEFVGKSLRGAVDEAFGLWGDRKIDGLAYQREVRKEW